MSWPRWCTDQQKQPEQPRSSPETQSSLGTDQRRREKPRRAQEKPQSECAVEPGSEQKCSTSSQIAPRLPPRGSKMVPKCGPERGPKVRLKRLTLRRLQKAPTWPQNGPRWPNMAPRWAQVPSRRAKMAPREDQDIPKRRVTWSRLGTPKTLPEQHPSNTENYIGIQRLPRDMQNTQEAPKITQRSSGRHSKAPSGSLRGPPSVRARTRDRNATEL